MKTSPHYLAALLFGLGLLIAGNAWAAQFDDFAMVSSTMGVEDGRVCLGEASRGDIGCPAYAPYVATDGTLSATAFVGDGSGLTNLNPSGSVNDRITSGTAGVFVSDTGVINLRTGGVTTGYLDTAGRLVAPGISITTANGISSTRGYFSGQVGIGTTAPKSRLDINGRINTTAAGLVDLDQSNGISDPMMLYNWNGTFTLASLDENFTYITTRMSLDINGNLSIAGTLYQNSDARLKKDIRPLPNALEKLSHINGVTFHWKDPSRSTPEQVGVIAQNVKQVYPQLVSADASGTLSVNYPGLVAPLIEAVKQLKADNDDLRTEFEAYKRAHP